MTTPASSKSKGRRLQQWTAKLILGIWPQLTDLDVTSCPMGSHGEDVKQSQLAKDLTGVDIECKSYKSFAIYSHYEQASTHGTKEPLLIIKADRKKPLAVVDAEWLFQLIKRSNDNGTI